MNKFGIPFDTDCISENILQTAFQPSTDLQIETLLPELESAGEFKQGLISPTFYEQLLYRYSFANKLQSQTVSTEKLRKTIVKNWRN